MNKALKLIEEAKEKKSKKLNIRHLELEEIPEEIGELTHLEEISLMYNNLEKLPSSFGNLVNLKRLHLSYNEFSEIPEVIYSLPKLQHVCIRNNQITEIPKNIEQLKGIRDIDLDDNQITSLPIDEESVDIIDNLSLWNNPLTDPPIEIILQGKEVLKLYLAKRGKVLLFTISLPEVILTPFKQYLLSFKEFISASKGRNFNLEVRSIDFGVMIEVEAEEKEDLDKFESYFAEYMGFIQQNVDDLKFDYEVEVTPTENEFIKLQIKQELQHLKMKCDMAEFKVTVLQDMVKNYKDALLRVSGNTPQIHLEVKQLQNANQLQLTKNITQLPGEIEKIRDYIEELRSIKIIDEALHDDVEDITTTLATLSTKDEQKIKKNGIWQKIKKLITDSSEVIKKTDEGFEGMVSIYVKIQNVANKLNDILEIINIGG